MKRAIDGGQMMHFKTEEALKKQADDYFNSIQPQSKRVEIEAMYAAFRARLMVELRIDGMAHQGAVFGYLEKR